MSEVPLIGSALFLIGCPRSGTTVLHRLLARHPAFWSPYGESHQVFEGPFRPDLDQEESNRVGSSALTAELRAQLVADLWASTMRHSEGSAQDYIADGPMADRAWRRVKGHRRRIRQAGERPRGIHLIEKTPKNCLRVPMLASLIPDSRFLFLERDAGRTIDSLISGWRAWDTFGPFRRKRYATYRLSGRIRLADAVSDHWCFALTPGWKQLDGLRVADAAAAQYEICSLTAARDLAELDPMRVLRVSYENLLSSPVETVQACLSFAGLQTTASVGSYVNTVLRAREEPALRFPAEVDRVLPAVAHVPNGIRSLLPSL